MPEAFDPYYIWLGIPPEEQPADHYRLLGIRRFESNPDVISNAADQRVRHLRSLQTGKRQQESQKLLTEIAQASGCLLDPSKRSAYDAQLRAQDAAKAAQAAPPGYRAMPPIPAMAPPASYPVVPYMPPHAAMPQHVPQIPVAATMATAEPEIGISLRTSGRRQKSSLTGMLVGGAVALLVVTVAGAMTWKLFATANKPEPVIAQTPPVAPAVTTSPPVQPPPATTPEVDPVTEGPKPATTPSTPPVVPAVTTPSPSPTTPTTTPTSPPITTTPVKPTPEAPATPAVVKAPPLPDSISVELGETTDVLSLDNFTPVSGNFDREEDLVSSTAGQSNLFSTPKLSIPNEQMILLDFTPEAASQGLLITSKIAGRRYTVGIDVATDTGVVSGLDMVDGTPLKEAVDSPWCMHKKVLVPGERTILQLVTTKNRIVLMVNGDTIINWQGSPSTLLPDETLLPFSNASGFAVAVLDAKFTFKKAQISAITKHNLGTDNKVAMTTKPGGEISIDPSKPDTDPSMPAPTVPPATDPSTPAKATTKSDTKTPPKTTKAPLGKKGQKLEPGLMVRVTATNNHTPTEMLGTITSFEDFRTALSGPIRVHTRRSGVRDDFHYLGFGYLILDKEETVKFNITNGIVLVDGAKLNTPTSGTEPEIFEKKLRKGSHPIILRPYDPIEPGPIFDIKDASGNDCLFYSPTDLMIEIQKPVRYYNSGQRGPSVFIFGNQPE